jgi:hypothetical protein
MANQVIVTNTGNVQVALTPPANVQVQISRAAIGTVSNVPTANFANYAGNVTVSNQPNITGLGTLTTLNVSGNGTVNNLTVTGNLSVGNLFANNANYSNFAGEAFNVSGSNVTGAVANATYANAANTANLATFATTANSVAGANVSGVVANANYSAYAGQANTSNLSTFATTANAVAGANVSGIVANANYASYANIANTANSVAVANVSGIGNIATVNLDGNASNILYGNGVFATTPIISNVANANFANFAGTAYSVDGANVSGTVANANYSAYAGEANTANLATYATTANSVAGANVSGEVANANYSSYANIAATANSVAVGNVSGIGNIATINLTGSSSNVLFGNGVFAPESTSIANANYANFAGNVINGTSNITIPSANGNITFSPAGIANAVNIQTTGQMNLQPSSSAINSIVINSYGNPTAGDVSRISSFRYRGNATTPLSVQPNDATMRFLTLGHNGSALQTNSVASIRALVDNSYTANGANIPIGWQILVNDTNSGVNNQTKTHNFYANGNVTFANVIFADGGGLSNIIGANVTGAVAYATTANSVAVANVSGIGNIATVNLTGSTSNVLYGNGVFAPESTTIANANYANFAGNLINGTSNVTIPSANGNVLFSVNNNANLISVESGGTLVNVYPMLSQNNGLRFNSVGRGSNVVGASRLTWSKSRGTIASPLSVEPGDYTTEILTFGHNGAAAQTNSVGLIRAVVDSSYTANGANIPIGWQFLVNDTNSGSNNQNKTQNFWANGNVTFNNAIFGNSLSVTGTVTGGNLTTNGTLTAIGNTGLGSLSTSTTVDIKGNNATGYVLLNGTQFKVTQDNANGSAGYSPFFFTTYQSNNDYIPASKFYRIKGTQSSPGAVDANSMVALNQYAVYADSGNTYKRVFEEQINVTGNDGVGNVSANLDFISFNTGSNINLNASNVTSNGNIKTSGNVVADKVFSNSYILANAYVQANSFTANYYLQVGNGAVSNARIYLNGDKSSNSAFIVTDAQFSVTLNEVNPAGFSPFFFSTYSSANSQIAPVYYYRARGIDYANGAAVTSGDVVNNQVSAVYADSGNAFIGVAQQLVTVQSNDGVGNVTVDYKLKVNNTGSYITLDSVNSYANNFTANNVSVNSNGFMKLASYTAANLTAITGQIGWMASVTNSGGGGNPNGMIAFWDTTHSRWSYIHDNSAV